MTAGFRRGKISKSMPGNQITSRLPCGRSISSSPCSTRSPTHAGPRASFTCCPIFYCSRVLAVITGGNSFRSIETFIKVHRRRLNAAFGLRWKRAPAHTAIRYILQGLDPQEVERVFRRHAAALQDAATDPSRRSIALDGKTLRRSFDNFNDRKAAQVLHAFDVEAGLILAHVDIEAKTNEIPAAQQLLGELKVAHCIITLDVHCKKTFEAAAQAQARVIIQLKDNQPLCCKMSKPSALPQPTSSDTEVTTGRGRHETRTARYRAPPRLLEPSGGH